jgi:hypothetical protein
VRRLMREHGLQAPHRVGHPHGPRAHDGTITTESPNVMWGTDMERHEALINRAVMKGHRPVLVAAGAVKLRAA